MCASSILIDISPHNHICAIKLSKYVSPLKCDSKLVLKNNCLVGSTHVDFLTLLSKISLARVLLRLYTQGFAISPLLVYRESTSYFIC